MAYRRTVTFLFIGLTMLPIIWKKKDGIANKADSNDDGLADNKRMNMSAKLPAFIQKQDEDELAEHLRNLFEGARLDQIQGISEGKPSFESWQQYEAFFGITTTAQKGQSQQATGCAPRR